jgi:hypothetical protein
VTQKLVEINEGEGDEPRIKLPADVVKWMRNRPQPPSYNAYICRRRPQHIIITIDVHSGVTPMFLGCKFDHCEAEMISASYPNNGRGPVPEHLREKPLWLWHRPNEHEFRGMPPEVRGHVMQGGLVLREYGKSFAEWEKEHAKA